MFLFHSKFSKKHFYKLFFKKKVVFKVLTFERKQITSLSDPQASIFSLKPLKNATFRPK